MQASGRGRVAFGRGARGVLRGGDDELHFAAGLGLVLEKVQIDLGVDVSDLVDTVSLSTIYSF